VRASELLAVPLLTIQTAIAEAPSPWDPVLLERHLSREEAMALEEASPDLPGVELRVRPSREYIGGNALSHILGYIGPQTPEEAEALAARGVKLRTEETRSARAS